MTRVTAMMLALLLTAAAAASAHEVRPGFLELRETEPGSYGFLWKKPTGGEIEIFIAPVVPAGCRFTPAAQQQLTPGALVVRGMLRCDGGIEGKKLAIDGLEATVTDVIVRVLHRDGRLESYLLKPMQPTVTLGAVACHGRADTGCSACTGRPASSSSGSGYWQRCAARDAGRQ